MTQIASYEAVRRKLKMAEHPKFNGTGCWGPQSLQEARCMRRNSAMTIGPIVDLTPGSISIAVGRLVAKGLVSRVESACLLVCLNSAMLRKRPSFLSCAYEIHFCHATWLLAVNVSGPGVGLVPASGRGHTLDFVRAPCIGRVLVSGLT